MNITNSAAAEEFYYAGLDTFTISTTGFSLTQAATTVVYVIPDLANSAVFLLIHPTGQLGLGNWNLLLHLMMRKQFWYSRAL